MPTKIDPKMAGLLRPTNATSNPPSPCGHCFSGNHRFCRGGACTCECEKRIRCFDCGHADPDVIDNGHCIDAESCAARVAEKRQGHPWLQEAQEKAAEANEEAKETRRERQPTQAKTGRCEHCGEPTKGGRFVAGHDMKLKGSLIRDVLQYVDPHEGDAEDVELAQEALAEMESRGWNKRFGKPRPGDSGQTPERIRVLWPFVEAAGKAWLDKRVAMRLQALEAGE